MPSFQSLLARLAVPGILVLFFAITSSAADPSPASIQPGIPPRTLETLEPLDLAPVSELRNLIERFRSDLGSLERTYPLSQSVTRHDRLEEFYRQWRERLTKIDFATLGYDAQIDYLLLANYLEYHSRQLQIIAQRREEIAPLVPFAPAIIELEEVRRRMEPQSGRAAAETLTKLKKQIDLSQQILDAALAAGGSSSGDKNNTSKPSKVNAYRAALVLDDLRDTLKQWHTFYHDYDPGFTWWAAEPYQQVNQALLAYSTQLREKVVGYKAGDESAIVGNPIGREALISDLASELIPYSPEELIAIAEKEFAWCETQMRKAAQDMGCKDWKEALEKVKQDHVQPGEQPALIKELAQEAIDFLEANDLVTLPPLSKETWRMEMMSPQRQLVNPFFTGGEVISVSYPTSGMTHAQKLMTLRGNNKHFARATVHHELFPGHHLQGYMADRYRPHRELFRTPFLVEGWALYWEMLLWDMNFAKSPENRAGMLFWRSHRCARIIFSLKFHLGEMTPTECIDFLVDRVGHERENAAGEVRRSFKGDYPPLYQAAYMLGGLQIRTLHKDLVQSGQMTNREFHDAILKENMIPIELIRASLTRQPLSSDFKSSWRFYDLQP